MNSLRHAATRLTVLMMLLSALISLEGMNPLLVEGIGGTQSWIDAPLNGSSLPIGPVEVVSHSTSPAGLAQVELSVDGVPSATEQVTGGKGSLVTARQTWKPAAPGNYTLMLRAKEPSGSWGEYAKAVVTIGGQPTLTPTPRTLRAPTSTPRPREAVTSGPTATSEATPTEQPRDAATNTVEPTAREIPARSSGQTASPTAIQPEPDRPTSVPTDTPVPARVVTTNTPVPPRVVPSDTPVPPRVVPSDTPVPPRVVPTATPVPPRVVPTNTPVPPRVLPTATPTSRTKDLR